MAETESSAKTFWIVSARIPETVRTRSLFGARNSFAGTVSVTTISWSSLASSRSSASPGKIPCVAHAWTAVAPASSSVDLRSFLSALKAVRHGDFSVRLPDHWTGVAGKVADTFNEVVEMNQRLASELERLHLAIGQHDTSGTAVDRRHLTPRP